MSIWGSNYRCVRQVRLPPGASLSITDRGILLRGARQPVAGLATSLRELSTVAEGSCWKIGSYRFAVVKEPPSPDDRRAVALPAEAWNILASKFLEVVSGLESSPFYFGDCGYLSPRPAMDFGVEIVE